MAEWNPASLDDDLDAFLKANREESTGRGCATGEGPSWATTQEGPSWAPMQEELQTPSRPSCRYQSTGDTRRIVSSVGQSYTLADPPVLVHSTFSSSGGLEPKAGHRKRSGDAI